MPVAGGSAATGGGAPGAGGPAGGGPHDRGGGPHHRGGGSHDPADGPRRPSAPRHSPSRPRAGAGLTRGLLVALALLLTVAACTASPTVAEMLRDGGLVLAFRHAATDTSVADADPTTPGPCELQRPLSEAGREQARAIGAALAEIGVEVGEVRASPYCRTVDTATLAFGEATEDPGLISLTTATQADRREALIAAMQERLAAVPAPGTVTVLVTHTQNLEEATGRLLDEGEALVVAPDGQGGFTILAQVPWDGWGDLDDVPVPTPQASA